MKNLILITYFGIVSLLTTMPITPFIILPTNISKKILRLYGNSFLLGLIFVLKFFYGCKIMIKNADLINSFKNKETLLLANHISQFDYMFLYSILSNYDIFNMMKLRIRMIMTKIVYRCLPGIGMFSIYLKYICVNRCNKNRTLNTLAQFKIKKDDVVIIFCEGDIQNEKSMEKSIDYGRNCKEYAKEYAEIINQEPMQYIMCPKTQGINTIYSNNKLDVINYATIVYGDIKLPVKNRINLTNHNIPKQIFISFAEKKIDHNEDIGSQVIDIYSNINSEIKLIKELDEPYQIKKDFIYYGITLKETLSFISQIILFLISINMMFKYYLYFWYSIFIIFVYYLYTWMIL